MIISLIRMIRAFSAKLRDDSISAFAAQAAFFIILSFFPFVIFLLTLLRYIPFFSGDIITLPVGLFPEAISPYIESILKELVQNSSGTVLSVAVIAALWSASRGVLALTRGLNAVYGHKETRNYFVIRSISTLYTLIFAILLIISLGLLVFGNQIYQFILEKIPFLGDFALVIMSIRSLTSMILFTLFFVLLYKLLPNGKSKFLYELPGAIFTAAGWLLFSYLFSYYIDHMGNFSYTYGSLTAIIICMLWLYFCMYILFIGAEINVVLSHPDVNRATKAYFAYRRLERKKRRQQKKAIDTDTSAPSPDKNDEE